MKHRHRLVSSQGTRLKKRMRRGTNNAVRVIRSDETEVKWAEWSVVSRFDDVPLGRNKQETAEPRMTQRRLEPPPKIEQKETKETKETKKHIGHSASAMPPDECEGSLCPLLPSFASVQNLRGVRRNKT